METWIQAIQTYMESVCAGGEANGTISLRATILRPRHVGDEEGYPERDGDGDSWRSAAGAVVRAASSAAVDGAATTAAVMGLQQLRQ